MVIKFVLFSGALCLLLFCVDVNLLASTVVELACNGESAIFQGDPCPLLPSRSFSKSRPLFLRLSKSAPWWWIDPREKIANDVFVCWHH